MTIFLNGPIDALAKNRHIFDCSYTKEELNEIVTRLAEAIGEEDVVLTKQQITMPAAKVTFS